AQPLGKGSIVLGGGAKTATLDYSGATATAWTQVITLGDGGIGQFNLSQAGTVSTLTVGGVISGAGGLTVLSPVTAGSGLILGGTNTYMGVTTIKSGAKISLSNSAGLGGSGTIANGTVIESGGALDIQDGKSTADIITVSGSGIGGAGAITYNGASTDMANQLKYLILAGDATVGGNGTKSMGVSGGFIRGQGYNFTVAQPGAFYLDNLVVDNVPTITFSTGSLYLRNMTLGGGASQSLVFLGSGKQLQLRAANVDRALTFGSTGQSILATSTGGADNIISQDITQTVAASTLSLRAEAGNSLVIRGNLLSTVGDSGYGRYGGNVVLQGAANTGTGTFTLQGVGSSTSNSGAGIARIMPIYAGNLANPFQGTNPVAFTAAASTGVSSLLYNNLLVLDNSATTGTLSQAFGALTTALGVGPTVQLNNTTGNSLSLTFTGYARTAGSELLLGITGVNSAPSSTNKIDIANYVVNQGVFWNGSSYVTRDAGNYLRPINYATDTGTNNVTSATASLANIGDSTNHTLVSSTGSLTAQTTTTIGTLALNGGASVALASGATLTLGTAGVLKTGGGTATISGGAAFQLGTAASTDAVLRVDGFTDVLNISTPLAFFNATGQTLSKFGDGQLKLSGAATVTGTMNVEQGTVRLAGTNAFGAVAANTITMTLGAALEFEGGIVLPNNLAITASGNNNMGWMLKNTGVLRNISGNNLITGAVSGGGYWRINSDADTLTIANLTNTAAGTFGGSGNIVVNAYSGAIDLTKSGTGALTYRPTASFNDAGKTVAIQGGSLTFDFSNMATPANVVDPTAILLSQGGSLSFVGKALVGSTQTFATFTQKDGITRVSATNVGTSLAVNFGAFATNTVFGTIDFAPTAGVTYSATASGAAVNVNGIMAGTAATNGFATAGNDWAVVNGTSILNYVTNGGTYTTLPASAAVATTNYNMVADTTITATQALNSLKIDSSAGAVTLSVASAQQLNTNALLFVGANGLTLAGAGTIGSTTANNYLHIQGAGNVTLTGNLADNSTTASTAWVIAGTGTGGFAIASTGAINFASNTYTDYLLFEGGLPGASRQVSNAGGITFASKGGISIANAGNDSIVFTNTGAISMTAGTFKVGDGANTYGKYVQSGSTSSFSATGANVLFASSTLASITNTAFLSAGSADFDLQAGTFAVGGTSGAGNYLVFGGAGSFSGTQSGGTLTVNRPATTALVIGQDGVMAASATYAQTGGTLSVNGATIIGGKNGAIGSMTTAGSVVNFYQGLALGVRDFSQGTFTQNSGTVTIGTGINVSDATLGLLYGNNAFSLSLAYNQTTNAGVPAQTKGTYNLNGGELRLNGISTGQGNGYAGTLAVANTFTDASNIGTTTTGGVATFNWGAATVRPFDSDLNVGAGIAITLVADGATLNTDDTAGISRLASFDSPIVGSYGLTLAGS
ncbi:MAG: hypothetical protein EBR83_06225, partial [Verrucomicrobia bacterium]|nr:hypothetical protein [Verrucomicrobiota bacterium]